VPSAIGAGVIDGPASGPLYSRGTKNGNKNTRAINHISRDEVDMTSRRRARALLRRVARAFVYGAVVLAVPRAPKCAVAQEGAIDLELARQYFQEVHQLWDRDGGKLWGMRLHGPFMFADRKTHQVIADQADEQGKLTEKQGVFVGQLPPEINIANTTLAWAGVHWTMVAWPTPKNPWDRGALLVHESWHRIQTKLGFPFTGPTNVHLDTLEGRIWLRLEWRALARALGAEGDARKHAIEDALLFRAKRRALLSEASDEERTLEMHEGLAEYTGVRLCGLEGAALDNYMKAVLDKRPDQMSTFVRSFAYLSGPAYGLLLDASGADWRKDLKSSDDFGLLLARAYSLSTPASPQQASERANAYDGESLRAAEEDRERKRQATIAHYRALLVDGPVLEIPLRKMQMQLDPSNVQPLDKLGTVYPTLRVNDVWGVLTVSRGALVSSDFKKVVVAAPSDASAHPPKGDGWQMALKDGWVLRDGKRQGDFVLVEQAK
jgi:hypothetical protein